MRKLALAGFTALAILASPAAAQETPYDCAVAARLSGDAERALDLLQEWLAENPGDSDALVQRGYALMALGRLEEAQQAFERALAIAPGYTDAADGLALVAQRREGGPSNNGFILIESALSDLSGQQAGWKEVGILALLPVGARSSLEMRGNWYERFSLEDVELGAQVTNRASDDLWLRLGVSVTPSADFRPETSLNAGLDFRLASATVASLDAGWQDFPLQQVWSLRPGVTQYFGSGRYALSAQARAVFAEDEDVLLGASLRADYLPSERARIFLGAASGPETDLGEVLDTTSIYGGGEVPLTDGLSLVGSVAHEWRDSGADRLEGRIGMKFAL